MFRFDCHVHSHHSKDARGTVLELAEAAAERGMHAFALTDHDTIAGHAEIADAMKATGVLIVPGIEVSSAEGHVLALGVSSMIPKGQSLPDTVAMIERVGGLAVLAHPLRMFTGIGPTGLAARAAEGHVPAIEVVNARERLVAQDNTLRLVEPLGRPMLGGSDAHWIHDIGMAYTLLEGRPKDAAHLLRLVAKGKCHPGGQSIKRRKVWAHGVMWRARRITRR